MEYYTGAIFEVNLKFDVTNNKGQVIQFGSIGGGGRYDNLVNNFGNYDAPATGISIGLDRLVYALMQKKDFKIIYHKKNMGKGSCIKSAIEKASGEICIIQDADLEYDPKEHLKVINPILQNKADVVYGSRFKGGDSIRLVYFVNALANKFLTFLLNLFFHLRQVD